MIRIAITQAAFDAVDEHGQRVIWLDKPVVDAGTHQHQALL
jgi:hypothetical protein